MIGQNKWDLDTPCLVIDLDLFENNLYKIQNYVKKFNKNLRPHCKTHKCSIIAKKQIEAGAIGLCTTKISEAEILIKNRIFDILVTSPQVTKHKIKRVINCLEKDPNFMVVVDNQKNAEQLNEAAKLKNLILNVLIDVDGGQGRTGIEPEKAFPLGKYIHDNLSNLRLRGVQCYLGHIQHIISFEERKKLSLENMKKGVNVFHQLKSYGIPCDILTGGGTGTLEIDVNIPEMTDIQAGSYICMDVEYKNIECSEKNIFDRPPMTLLATVINDQKLKYATIDAGLKAIYQDGPGPKVNFLFLKKIMLNYPKLECTYKWKGDEHGQLEFIDEKSPLKNGEIVELIVSHCDPTINLYDQFYISKEDKIVDIWPIDMRGCVK
jgi:D-serine deaminase-like pyridoxal phosphate-dependent protein